MTWITFITGHQAHPGRRMRWNEQASHIWTVQGRERRGGIDYILFAEGRLVRAEEAKRKRWQIEV
jgi:hypothetical protein